MKKVVLLFSLLGVALLMSVQAESFEPPNYQAGQPLNEDSHWQSFSPSGLVVTAAQAAEGAQSLQITQGTTITTATHPGGVKFYQFYLLANFDEAPTEPAINVAGAQFSLSRINATVGGVAVFASSNAPIVLPRSTLPLVDDTLNSETWVLVTIRVDGDQDKWDLYLDGKPIVANLALSGDNSTFTLTATTGEIYLDDYTESTENPLFIDSDHDGLPDAEEVALGLNAYGEDRTGDLDGDGISNADEYFAGISPAVKTGDQAKTILYVDNLRGSDANTGSRSYPLIGNDGPKSSVKAAMASAPDVATIVVLPGKGIYEEGSRGAENKQLTIKTVAPVTIR